MTASRSDSRAPCAGDAAIDVDGVAFQYPTQDREAGSWALEDLSFHVRTGEVLGIVGPNGSGKSSLLKIVGGLLRPNKGHVRLAGKPMGGLARREVARLVAMVPQEYVQVFPFTVAETVLMGRFPHRAPHWWALDIGDETARDLACAEQAMMDTDVLSLADRSMADLSGGERQRVVIARALAQEPAILLLDEPTAFLDINHQIEICGLISALRAERSLTVVLVSHDLNVASQYCDRLLMLKEGRLYRMGSPWDTVTTESLRAVYGCTVVVDAHPQS